MYWGAFLVHEKNVEIIIRRHHLKWTNICITTDLWMVMLIEPFMVRKDGGIVHQQLLSKTMLRRTKICMWIWLLMLFVVD